MKILVLGGTAFLGRTFVEAAVERGHKVTLFNRGQRDASLFPELETIYADRTLDVSALGDGRWDVVFDACGYVPRVVGMSVKKCLPWAERYMFISSISVFKDVSKPGLTEDSGVAELADPAIEEITGETYGGLKALCEKVVTQAFGVRALIVRPGLIVGPRDYSDRFTYWPLRMSLGGEVLVPSIRSQPVQVIDVRDLADLCLALLEDRSSGIYNVTGPEAPYSFEEVIQASAEGTEAELKWVDSKFLAEHNVQPWSDLPLALDFDGSGNGMLQIDISKALSAGLKLRSLAETVNDTRAWAITRPTEYKLKAGLTLEREAELLGLWRTGGFASLPQ